MKHFQNYIEKENNSQSQHRVILLGDFNAHTGTKEDTISADKFDQDAELGENFTLPSRNSEDSSPTNIREGGGGGEGGGDVGTL